ncbi:MAG: bifunctional diaminohydroxyphosphoribosylaminopyrimidine deaminase/5-amino-6-(5-phosphoribosylamino)uracil reductase RibD [Candidatus Omnitrophica bacterium]|nr:bifunctional diaminohydroxyphosphoribosylaminopyrimidine deaminase/5-amino-6-(5-phosphoribosylamino)uracil reductase RibD [Candidatus Omnitrophota bacterium]
MSKHGKWIDHCIRFAQQGRGRVSPNPMVGACVVKKGKLIAGGYHSFFGGPHAEVVALKKAGFRAKGATLYVSLEPCSTYGKTPPCTDAILKSSVNEVIVGALDPNPRHHKKGISILKKAGVKVSSGILADKVAEQNEAFFTFHAKKRPFVILKMAESLDGKITTAKHSREWISGLEARKWVHRLRSKVDAILVGTRTVENDNPRLVPYLLKSKSKSPRLPLRVILDRTLKLSRHSKVFGRDARTVVFSSKNNSSRRIEIYAKDRRVEVFCVGEKKHRLNIKEILRELYRLGISSLMVEGGGEICAAFLAANAVDKVCMFIAPLMLGGGTSVRLRGVRCSRTGEDFLIEGYVK